MQSPDSELWWAVGVGSATLVIFAVAYIATIVSTQSRFIAEQRRQLEEVRRSDEERRIAQEELRTSYVQLRNLSARLQSIREEEQNRIAREIHDEIGQILTVVKMHMSVAEEGLLSNPTAKPSVTAAKLGSIIKLVDESIDKVKHVASQLRPYVLEHLGLKDGIESEVAEFQQRTGIRCEVQSPPQEIAIDNDRATAVFRIFQEALTNIARHSGAKAACVTVRCDDGKLLLDIRDDGKGITKGETNSFKSLGILGMKERAVFLGGELHVFNGKENGTVVSLSVPLTRS